MAVRKHPKFLGVWLSVAGWQAIEERAKGKRDRSDVVRRLLSYATQHMPEGLETVTHVIEFEDEDDGRAYWQCDCGAAGSVPADMADLAAEKHVREGEPVSYRTRLTR